MTKRSLLRSGAALGAIALLASLLAIPGMSDASSHRDAPLIAEDPVADNTDVYAFVAPDAPNHVTLISNFIPLQEPAGGPNFYNFGEDVLYEIKVDNDGDATAEAIYQFRFSTTINDPTTPLYNEGTISFSGGQYQNLNIQQTYTVTEILDGVTTVLASNVPVAPANIGPRSTPNYDLLAANAITPISVTEGTMRVFAGPRDEAFPVDLGSIFDLGALRPLNMAHLAPLDQDNGVNATTGFNVHSIAIQIPKARIVDTDPVIGVHSTASRQENKTIVSGNPGSTSISGSWVQISRLGNPLVNEVVVPLSSKDTFNFTPMSAGDSAFQPIVEDPRIGQLLPVLYPGAFGNCYPTTPRNDLVTIYLTGIPGLNQPMSVTASEQLRLNTSIAPTAWDQQNPLGLLAGQNDGFPNGRRPADDVVDISLRAVAGATAVGACNGIAPNNALGDGVSGNDRNFLNTFPYLPSPHAGYDHVHDHSAEDDPTTDTRSHQIRRLYLAFFLRAAEAAGFEYWLDSDQPMNSIAQLFAESAEFQARYGSLSDEDYVERVYLNVLKRASDSGGKAYWVELLSNGVTRGQVMLAFSNADEFKRSLG